MVSFSNVKFTFYNNVLNSFKKKLLIDMYLYQWLGCQTNRWQKCVSHINEAYNNIWEELDSAVLYLKASFLLASLMFLSLYKINPKQMSVSNCKKKRKSRSTTTKDNQNIKQKDVTNGKEPRLAGPHTYLFFTLNF